jgi:integrase
MGCKVHANRHGYLHLRVNYQGRQWSEGTGLKDTPANRKFIEAKALIINREMKAGHFSYIEHFPAGNRAREFEPEKPKPVTVGRYFETWIQTKVEPITRWAQILTYRQHFNAYILPRFKRKLITEVTQGALEELRVQLLERGLAVKTCRNVINASFRSLMRDAGNAEPFKNLQWPTIVKEAPDPFTEAERDKILDYFYRKQRREYPFPFTQFWTGMRPSETTALRWGSVDLEAAKLTVARSRVMAREAAPKTRASRRTVELLPDVVEVLRSIQPLRVTENDHVFKNARGGPIEYPYWRNTFWQPALRACRIRPRKFYATRHTFISVALSMGANPKWLSEQVGTSMAMIEQSYGRYIRTDGLNPLREAMRKSSKKRNTKA